MKHQTLTIIIHTKNEESHIRHCIASIQSLHADILVVDMHSSDNTRKIAERMGAKVIVVKDYGYVEPARMFAIQAVHTPWILILDADERSTPTLNKTILWLIKENLVDAVNIPFKNYAFGRWLQHGVRWPDYHIRLFKKNSVKWPKTIHSQAEYTGCVYTLPATEKNAIIHNNVLNVEQLINKINGYTLKETWYAQQSSLTPTQIRDRILHEFQWRFFEHQGYKDGTAGFVMAKIMEYYRFLEFLYHWERSGYPEQFKHGGKYKDLWKNEHVNNLELQEIKDSWLYRALWKPYSNMKQILHLIRK